MVKNKQLGVILSVIGALLGIVGHFVILINWYGPALVAESAEPGCEILLKYIMPLMFDIGVAAGVFFAVGAYGFATAQKWAYPLVVIAAVLSLQGSWFVNVPFMAASMPPVYFTLFWPYLVLYFLLTKVVGKTPWNRLLLSMATGMTFIFSFMNGVASTSRIITIGTPLFVAVQRLHWVSMVGWGIVTVMVLLRPTEKTRLIGLLAALMEIVVGIPLAIATTIGLARFSMFSVGPIFSFALLIVFVVPVLWEKFTGAKVE